MDIQKLEKSQIKQAALVFAKAMMNDDVHLSFFPNQETRLRKLTCLYEYKLELEYKSCYTTSRNIEGLAIWEAPGEQHTGLNLLEIISGIKLIWQCGIRALFRMIRYQNWASKTRDRIATQPYWYLNVIAVDPEHQGKGFASKLIKPIIKEAVENKHMIYLETQNKNNVKIYEKYGFRLVDEILIPKTSVIHYCMKMDYHLTMA
jgi:ribosomal protein S18 acetylase RimI-like enzyme